VIGDFSAKTGPDRHGVEATVSPHGSAEHTNDNGDRSAMTCSTSGLCVGNTLFKHKKMHITTWTSPDCSTQNETDYICISRRWLTSLQDVWACRWADVSSDHNLVIAKICTKLLKLRKVQASCPFELSKLKDPETSSSFRIKPANRFTILQDSRDVMENWQAFQEVVKESAETTLGRRKGSYKKRWISDESWKLIDKRKQIKTLRDQTQTQQQKMNEDYRHADKEVKKVVKMTKEVKRERSRKS